MVAGLNGRWQGEVPRWLDRATPGYHDECSGSACEFALDRWKLVRIAVHVFDFNQASARVLQKNRFEFEGLLQKHHRKDGEFLDSKLHALVK